MERWAGRVALVTGASSGIGKAIASRLASHGMKVVACGRNMQRLQDLSEEFRASPGTIIPVQCDMRVEQEILAMFDKIRSEFGGVDVCINNAGLLSNAPILSSTTDKWREMLDVNVLAVCICSREAVKSMRERSVDDGVIININSMTGHRSTSTTTSQFYGATKCALKSISEGTATELRHVKSKIRVLQISPGQTETEIFERGLGKKASDRIFKSIETLKPEDIADSVEYGLSAPPHVVVTDILLRPTEQMF